VSRKEARFSFVSIVQTTLFELAAPWVWVSIKGSLILEQWAGQSEFPLSLQYGTALMYQ
jgi:hypothetical protein